MSNKIKPNVRKILKTLRNPKNLSNYELELLTKSLFARMTLEQEFLVAYHFIQQNSPYFLNQHPELSWLERWLDLTSKFEVIDYSSESFRFYDGYESKEAHWFAYAISVVDSTYRRIIEGYKKEDFAQRDDDLSYAIAIIIGTRMETHRRTYFPDSTISEKDFEQHKPEVLMARVEKYKNSKSRKQLQKKLWARVADAIEAHGGLSETDDLLSELADEALKEHRAGKTKALDLDEL